MLRMGAARIASGDVRVARRACRASLTLALVAGAVALVGRPTPAGAQGGGTVEVTVTYQGPPQIETLKVEGDVERCGTEARIERIAVGATKGLANAVVSAVGLRGAPPARRAEIDQRRCRFVPHVVAMTPGEIDVRNSDGILHNFHTHSIVNPSINTPQPKFKKVMTETLEKPEIIKVTCDVHGWMLAWIAVLSTPFFGVTDARGVARLENMPAGRHTIEVWHETLGTQTRDVEVRAGEVARVTIEMRK